MTLQDPSFLSSSLPHLDMEAGQRDVGPSRGAAELQLLICQGFAVSLLTWGPPTEHHLTLLERRAAQPSVAFRLDQVGLEGNIPGILPEQSHKIASKANGTVGKTDTHPVTKTHLRAIASSLFPQ